MFLDDENATRRLRSRNRLSFVWLAAIILVACVVMLLGVISTVHAESMLG
ncbi:hypothetical protein [Rhizobium sp. BK251]|nr:hypothetical protein [Rhizobium sp. BK251]TCL74790.1 hypothetical protein EV286_102351 [Rhizobium sp. BK251]